MSFPHLLSALCPGPFIALAIVVGAGDVPCLIVEAESSESEAAVELPVVFIFLLDISTGVDLVDLTGLLITGAGNHQVNGIVPTKKKNNSQAKVPVSDSEMQDDHIDDTEHEDNSGDEGTPLDLGFFHLCPIHNLFCTYIVGEVVTGEADWLLGWGGCMRKVLVVEDVLILY